MYSYTTRAVRFSTIILFAVLGFSQLTAQSMAIADVVVAGNATRVDVPISINIPDSISAIQLSVLWSEDKLRLDSLTYSSAFRSENFTVLSNVLEHNEIRIGVIPVFSHISTFGFTEDSAAFVLSFTLLSDFKGSAEVRFNPDFPIAFSDYYGNHIPSTILNGTITSPEQTTSNRNVSPSAGGISVYPNPANSKIRLSGLSNNSRNSDASIIDEQGRELWSGKLSNASLAIPKQLPNGNYWLVLKLKDGICSKQVVILR